MIQVIFLVKVILKMTEPKIIQCFSQSLYTLKRLLILVENGGREWKSHRLSEKGIKRPSISDHRFHPRKIVLIMLKYEENLMESLKNKKK